MTVSPTLFYVGGVSWVKFIKGEGGRRVVEIAGVWPVVVACAAMHSIVRAAGPVHRGTGFSPRSTHVRNMCE